jgi:hypothetical protein
MIIGIGLAAMSQEERAATEAYAADLRQEFRRNVAVMEGARTFRNLTTYHQAYRTSRNVYQEIAEVEFALATGVLPF